MKLRKILSMVLAGVMLCSFTGCGKEKSSEKTESISSDKSISSSKNITVEDVKNAKPTKAKYFEYDDVDGGVAITGYRGKDEILVIPDKIDNKPIVAISEYAFVNNDSFKGLRLSDTIKIIEEHAFENCFNLEIVIMGESLKKIDEFVFNGAKKLYYVELNEKLETIDTLAFGLCNIKEIYIPESVININIPFTAAHGSTTTIIGVPGSAAEKFVNESPESAKLVFKAKE